MSLPAFSVWSQKVTLLSEMTKTWIIASREKHSS